MKNDYDKARTSLNELYELVCGDSKISHDEVDTDNIFIDLNDLKKLVDQNENNSDDLTTDSIPTVTNQQTIETVNNDLDNSEENNDNDTDLVIEQNVNNELDTIKEIAESINIRSIEPIPIKTNLFGDDNISNEKAEEVNTDSIPVNQEQIKKDSEIYHNKTVVDGKNVVDDDDFAFDAKKSLRDIIMSHKVFSTILILTFICVCVVVVKTFYFGKKVNEYEESIIEITHKEEGMTKIYAGNEFDNEVLKKMAASELVKCIETPIDINSLPDSVNSIINQINNYYNSSYDYFSFAYKDIFTGFTVTYNANQPIFTASAIKAPTDIYIYEMASQGKIDLNEIVTYTGNYYNAGTGVLKNKPIGTQYSVRTLLEYSTVTSDNAVHNMLMDKYGRENMLNYWSSLGTTTIFTQPNNWGVMNANDALIYMSELYNFYVKDDTYGEEIMKNFLNAHPSFLKGKDDNLVANKGGWSGTAIHDVAIIFANNPYIVVALSNTGESDYDSYFSKANQLAYILHEEYWKYKMSTCEGIKQY